MEVVVQHPVAGLPMMMLALLAVVGWARRPAWLRPAAGKLVAHPAEGTGA